MFSELLGTLVLVSVVLGASVPGPGEDHVGPLSPAAAVGVAIVALAHCFGEMSGAQVGGTFQRCEYFLGSSDRLWGPFVLPAR